jgi:2-phosphosulfolactate phosphatase
MIQFSRATLSSCREASGVVVVIDVLRAFTSAAYAFASGAHDITLVSTVEEALDLRARIPGALAMGEVGGLPIPGFDFGNSPAEFVAQDLAGKRLIQRTTTGTQGVVRCSHAEALLASSFVCARATAAYIHSLAPHSVTFVISGAAPDQRFSGQPIHQGDEDLANADYLEGLLLGEDPDPQPFLRRVLDAPSARKFHDPGQPAFSAQDLQYCTAINRFDFAMVVHWRAGLPVMQPVRVT